MTQNLETKENVVSLETTDISKEIGPADRGKVYSKEELQKDETWKDINELFEFTAKEVILESSNYGAYFLKKVDKDGNILKPTNFSEYRGQVGVVENEEKGIERKNQYISEIKEILSNEAFIGKYKEAKGDTTFLNVRNTLRSIIQLQRDFGKKFTNDQLGQITSCINKMQEKNSNTELIPANSDVYVYYNPFLIKDVSTINKMFSHITGEVQIDNCKDENIDKEGFKKNLKDTIESKLKNGKNAHICIMDHGDPYKNGLIEIGRFTGYLEELDKSGIDLSNLTISTFSCGGGEFQINLYKDLKDKGCKTFPRGIYSQANINQYSRAFASGLGFAGIYSIGLSGLSTNIIGNWVNSEAQTVYTSNEIGVTNDPMIQISNTTIEQQVIKETVVDEELKNFLLNQTSFQIAEAESSKNKFNNIS